MPAFKSLISHFRCSCAFFLKQDFVGNCFRECGALGMRNNSIIIIYFLLSCFCLFVLTFVTTHVLQMWGLSMWGGGRLSSAWKKKKKPPDFWPQQSETQNKRGSFWQQSPLTSGQHLNLIYEFWFTVNLHVTTTALLKQCECDSRPQRAQSATQSGTWKS